MEQIHLSLGFAVPMALGVAAFGGALGLGRAVGEAVAGISRQPEAATNIQGAMIIGCAFIEALTIYALVALFVLSGKITG